MTRESQLLEWMQRYLHGIASGEEARQLADCLRADPEVRDQFIEYLNIDLALEEFAAEEELTPALRKEAAPGVPRRTWPRLVGLMMAIALLAMLTRWTFDAVPPEAPHQVSAGAVIAEVTSLNQVEVGSGTSFPALGEKLELSRVHLVHGALGLRLESGVEVEFQAPVDATLESPLRLRLASGRVNADVGERGRGFTIVTAAGEVVDLGTRFSVQADDEGETRTAVISGEVRIYALDDAGQREASWSLFEGEAVRFHRRETPRRISSLFLSSSGAVSPTPAESPLIAEVSDNLSDQEQELRRFYGVVAEGMREGAAAYTDHERPRWRALPGQAFPPELEGADQIRTFNSDRHARDLQLMVRLQQPATVYIVYDGRKPAPAWLASAYRETGLRLRCGPWRPESSLARDVPPDEDGMSYLQYSVWRRDVADASVIELGPPHPRGEAGPLAMYGVAIKPLHEMP